MSQALYRWVRKARWRNGDAGGWGTTFNPGSSPGWASNEKTAHGIHRSRAAQSPRAFSGEVDAGSPQKMRPLKEK
jgi:hypothetical protein